MIGERLKRARAAAGMSMRALADKAGISANMIKKYEHNLSMPSSGKIIILAKALGIKSEYFFRPTNVTLEAVQYRNRHKFSNHSLKKIEASVLEQVERWMELVNIYPSFPIKPFSPPISTPRSLNSLDEVDGYANQVRKSWDLGLNPIRELIDALEANGLLVIVTDIASNERFDGLNAIVGNQKIIVISSNWPGDRQRFTLAHELAHIVLNGKLSKGINVEYACDRFAASFLLPSEAIKSYLGESRNHLEDKELQLLKQEFGISMQACLRRAKDLGIITESEFKKAHKKFKDNDWLANEPGVEYEKQKTILLEQLVFRALGEELINESKAAEILGISQMKFHHTRRLGNVA